MVLTVSSNIKSFNSICENTIRAFELYFHILASSILSSVAMFYTQIFKEASQDDLDDLDEYLSFLSKKFSKLKSKRNPSMSKTTPSYRKDSNQNKSVVDMSKFKCYNYGIARHFSNECRKPKSDKRGNASDGINYRKKYFDLLRSKEKSFVSEEKDWAATGDDSDEEEFINFALMANVVEQEASSAISQVFATSISDLSKDECTVAIDDMSNELYNLHITLK